MIETLVERTIDELGGWFAERGFTCFVLFYRLPGDGWGAGPNVCLQDGQRAMRLIRQRAQLERRGQPAYARAELRGRHVRGNGRQIVAREGRSSSTAPAEAGTSPDPAVGP